MTNFLSTDENGEGMSTMWDRRKEYHILAGNPYKYQGIMNQMLCRLIGQHDHIHTMDTNKHHKNLSV